MSNRYHINEAHHACDVLKQLMCLAIASKRLYLRLYTDAVQTICSCIGQAALGLDSTIQLLAVRAHALKFWIQRTLTMASVISGGSVAADASRSCPWAAHVAKVKKSRAS